MIPWTVAHQGPLSMGFSGKNTGVGCHSLLQGIFPTQGSKSVYASNNRASDTLSRSLGHLEDGNAKPVGHPQHSFSNEDVYGPRVTVGQA